MCRSPLYDAVGVFKLTKASKKWLKEQAALEKQTQELEIKNEAERIEKISQDLPRSRDQTLQDV